MNTLIYSSAVMTLSQTTEFMRNKSIDNIIIHLIVIQGLKEFDVKKAYDGIYEELPIRQEEVSKSIHRSWKNDILVLVSGNEENLDNAIFKISDSILSTIDTQYKQLDEFVEQSINELFKGIVTAENSEDLKNLLLETVSNLMAKYGYAYAGQLAGIAEATEFVPSQELHEICETTIAKYNIDITKKDLANSISYLFDRRDPCLNSLAFSICNRYYQSRLIGLDLPVDFLTENLYKDSIIFLDTNFIGNIAFTKSKRHNEFREILNNAKKLGIRFAASELTIAEIHARVQVYMPELEIGEDLLPDELIEEVREEIIQYSNKEIKELDFNLEESENAKRLQEMGVEIVGFEENGTLFDKKDLKKILKELNKYDRKFRSHWPPKDDRALFHDAYHYFLIQKEREKSGSSAAWFLSMDHSVIEHAIFKKKEESPPYAIRLLSVLQTLSQFVESQALKGEFSELFGELIAKDLLPRDQIFNYEDLKLLIGFDIKSKDIPPEFVRKATHHIKTNILKGGGITEDNKAQVIYEYTKFLSTPDQNFVELQRKYDKKLRDKDDDIQIRDKKIEVLEKSVEANSIVFTEQMKSKDLEVGQLNSEIKKLKSILITSLVVIIAIGISLVLWFNQFAFYEIWLSKFNRPFFFNLSVQFLIISTCLTILFYEKKLWIIVTGVLITLGSIVGSLA